MSNNAHNENLLVIAIGSSSVRVGLAQSEAPETVPCLVAYKTEAPREDREREGSPTGNELKRYEKMKALFKQKRSKYRKRSRKSTDSYYEAVEGAKVYTEENCIRREPRALPQDFPNALVGEQILSVPLEVASRYVVHCPIQRGRFSAMWSSETALIRDVDALEAVIKHAVETRLNIPASSFGEYRVGLCVPGAFSRREIYEVYSILLGRLGFSACTSHLESVLACFGAGVSSACVVQSGAETTVVTCVQDGMIVPHTRCVMPVGGSDIDSCLFECLQYSAKKYANEGNFVSADTPLPFDFRWPSPSRRLRGDQYLKGLLMRELKEDVCSLVKPSSLVTHSSADAFYALEIKVLSGQELLHFGVNISYVTAYVASLGYFEPDLIAETVLSTTRSPNAIFYENNVQCFDYLDKEHLLAEQEKEPGAVSPEDVVDDDDEDEEEHLEHYEFDTLARAIVKSIESAGMLLAGLN